MLRPTSQEKQAVQQAQQPFEGEHPPDEQRAGFADAQAGLLAGGFEADARSGSTRRRKRMLRSMASASVGAVMTLRQRNSKAPAAHRLRKQAKAFIVEFAVDQVVEFGIAVDGNAGAWVVEQYLAGDVRTFEQGAVSRPACCRPASIPCTKAMATVARAGRTLGRGGACRQVAWQSSQGMRMTSRKAVY
jgi:hypothetical protein